MDEKERTLRILQLFREAYPGVKGTVLNFKNPLELLVATILSAQCTDKKVNEVVKELFKKYQTARDFAEADLSELERD